MYFRPSFLSPDREDHVIIELILAGRSCSSVPQLHISAYMLPPAAMHALHWMAFMRYVPPYGTPLAGTSSKNARWHVGC